MINDVSTAFFQAPIQRNICIEFPDDGMNEEDKGRDMIEHLNQNLYG